MEQLMRKPLPPNGWQPGRGSGRNTESIAAHSHSTIFQNALGQVVGRLEDGWLTKRVNTRKHQLRLPPGWACDAAHIEQLRRIGARGVRLIDEKGRVWTAPLARWQGLRTIDRGHDEQYVLPLNRWDVEDPTCLQMWLFEVAV